MNRYLQSLGFKYHQQSRRVFANSSEFPKFCKLRPEHRDLQQQKQDEYMYVIKWLHAHNHRWRKSNKAEGEWHRIPTPVAGIAAHGSHGLQHLGEWLPSSHNDRKDGQEPAPHAAQCGNNKRLRGYIESDNEQEGAHVSGESHTPVRGLAPKRRKGEQGGKKAIGAARGAHDVDLYESENEQALVLMTQQLQKNVSSYVLLARQDKGAMDIENIKTKFPLEMWQLLKEVFGDARVDMHLESLSPKMD